jgi:hypothetical protein
MYNVLGHKHPLLGWPPVVLVLKMTWEDGWQGTIFEEGRSGYPLWFGSGATAAEVERAAAHYVRGYGEISRTTYKDTP